MTLHKEIQIVFVAVRELLEVADAITTMRCGRGDDDDAAVYTAFPYPTKPATDCSELLDAVAITATSKRYTDNKLQKWETVLSKLLSRDVVTATQA